jgi:hypothetical protein
MRVLKRSSAGVPISLSRTNARPELEEVATPLTRTSSSRSLPWLGVATGAYPYNSSFEGRIPGLEDALPRKETPIYLLQQLRGLVEGHEYLAQILDAGYRRLTELATRERFASVVVFDRAYAAQRYDDARVVPDEHRRPSALLPKGKRTRGRRFASFDQVYVR